MEIASCALTDVGKMREHNEDVCLADPALGLFLVCDGMGGANAGEVASQLAATTIREVVATHREVVGSVARGETPPERLGAILREALETACRTVHDEAARDAARKGMGCTCTAFLVAGGKAALGHAGDSRLYLARGGAVTQLSQDHTWIAEAVRQGVFTPEEAEFSPYKNVITRSIGKERSVMVETLVFDLVLGDTVLVCSDGLHGFVKDPAELAQLLAGDAVDQIARHLIALANERGGTDNISAVVVRSLETAATGADLHARRSAVMANLGTLGQIELMQGMTMAEIVRLNQIFHEVEYPAGTIIIHEGEVSDALFVLVAGSAEVIRGSARIAVLRAGAHFGDMSLLSSRPRSATVRCLETSRLLAIDRARLYGFLQQDALIAAKVFWKLAETLSRRLDEVLAHQQ